VASRYTQLSNQWQGPFLTSAELSAIPDAFTLIDVDNMGTTDSTDQPNVVNALQNNQCFLMFDAWYHSDGMTLTRNFQTAAHVNGF
jgi:hypothetical protein